MKWIVSVMKTMTEGNLEHFVYFTIKNTLTRTSINEINDYFIIS